MANRAITVESLLANPSLILDRLCAGVLVVDMNVGHVLYSNDELARILGCSRQEFLIGEEAIWSLSHADDRVLYEATARRVMDKKIDRFRLVCRFNRRDGREVCAKILANVLGRSRSSTPVGFIFEELGRFNAVSSAVDFGATKAVESNHVNSDEGRPVDDAIRNENDLKSKVFHFVEENWNKRVSISQLSKIFRISGRTIHNYFAAENTTPKKYVKRLKLEHSRRMLQSANEDTTVTAVAFRCGFSNVSHYASDYKKQFGEIPSETLKLFRNYAAES